MDLSYADLKKLSELLKPEQESSDSEDDLPKTGLAKFGPGHIGAFKGTSDSEKGGGVEEGREKGDGDGKSIWEENEVPEGAVHDESDDPREKPEYEVRYKQAVSAEEMFLQMGLKTPATASCEDFVVDIKLPGEQREKVDLHITTRVLELRSPKYRLSLPLPHPVDTESSKALWASDSLSVTLRLARELDFVNF